MDILQKQNQLEAVLCPFVYGKSDILRCLEIAFLMGGHVLLEDFPGIGKKLFVEAFAKVMGKDFTVIHASADLRVRDITGSLVDGHSNGINVFQKGIIFSDIIYIDQINQLHPETKSAIFRIMEERAITIQGNKFPLPRKQMVVASQMPQAISKKTLLSRAEMEHFACCLSIGFPPREMQKQILTDGVQSSDIALESITRIFNDIDLDKMTRTMDLMELSDDLLDHMIQFVEWTRTNKTFEYGLSTRGMMFFSQIMKINAFLSGSDVISPHDGQGVMHPFLSHRVKLSEAYADASLKELLEDRFCKDDVWWDFFKEQEDLEGESPQLRTEKTPAQKEEERIQKQREEELRLEEERKNNVKLII